MSTFLTAQSSFLIAKGSLLAMQSSWLERRDQWLHYFATHRIAIYIGIGVAIVLIMAPLWARSRRRSQTSFSLNTGPDAPITPIDEAPGVRCTHCGVRMSARQDFCPTCGYAQPVRQTGTSPRFPG